MFVVPLLLEQNVRELINYHVYFSGGRESVNLGPTSNQVIWQQDVSLKSHSKDQRSRGSILGSLDW